MFLEKLNNYKNSDENNTRISKNNSNENSNNMVIMIIAIKGQKLIPDIQSVKFQHGYTYFDY